MTGSMPLAFPALSQDALPGAVDTGQGLRAEGVGRGLTRVSCPHHASAVALLRGQLGGPSDPFLTRAEGTGGGSSGNGSSARNSVGRISLAAAGGFGSISHGSGSTGIGSEILPGSDVSGQLEMIRMSYGSANGYAVCAEDPIRDVLGNAAMDRVSIGAKGRASVGGMEGRLSRPSNPGGGSRSSEQAALVHIGNLDNDGDSDDSDSSGGEVRCSAPAAVGLRQHLLQHQQHSSWIGDGGGGGEAPNKRVSEHSSQPRPRDLKELVGAHHHG